MLERNSSLSRGSDRLAERRRVRNRRISYALLCVVALAAIALISCTWLGRVRVTQVHVVGGSPDLSISAQNEQIVQSALGSSYLWLVPHNSIFFLPEANIRARILQSDLRFATVSITRDSAQSITVNISPRVAVARWCGAALNPLIASTTPAGDCYLFDAGGYLFALASSSDPVLTDFRVYAPLFDFARQVGGLGSAVERVALSGDEGNLYLATGARVRFVLGQEQVAYAALISSKDMLVLADTDIDYIDLRFSGKVYIKRKNVTVPE